MPCAYPNTAYQLADGTVVFQELRRHGTAVRTLQLPCGQCAQCRLKRSREWATRCMHEASLYDSNCFITLTYADEYCPSDMSLRYRDFQLFMKRLRRRFSMSTLRFYMCGEYGENFGRPHYHALLFNFDFLDKLYFKHTGAGNLYTSKTASELWTLGHSLIGAVTFESAAYVARYCMAKVTGDLAEGWYTEVNAETGEISQRVPEFNQMSRGKLGGIGAPWLRKYVRDVYPNDGVYFRGGKNLPPPRYYDKIFARTDDNDELGFIQYKRYLRAQESYPDNTDERLAVKEQVAIARLSRFSRSIE